MQTSLNMWTELRDGELKNIKKKSPRQARRLAAIYRNTSGNPITNRRPTERAALELLQQGRSKA